MRITCKVGAVVTDFGAFNTVISRILHFEARSCEGVSGRAGWIASRVASRSSALRECLGRNGPGHLPRGISGPRAARASLAKWAGSPRARHLGAQSYEDVSDGTCQTSSRAASRSQGCEDVPGETGWTTPREASRRSELRGCLKRNAPNHLERGISEPRVARMSQAKRAGTALARHLGAQSWEDVSGETGWTTSRAASRKSEF